MARNGTITARQQGAVLALLTHPTVDAAAQAAKVGLRTLWRWLNDPTFQEAYREARAAAVSRAIGRLQQVASDAVDALKGITADIEAPAAARVTSAKAILDLSIKSIELESLEARIRALEEGNEHARKTR